MTETFERRRSNQNRTNGFYANLYNSQFEEAV